METIILITVLMARYLSQTWLLLKTRSEKLGKLNVRNLRKKVENVFFVKNQLSLSLSMKNLMYVFIFD